jgi:hypothetical protein
VRTEVTCEYCGIRMQLEQPGVMRKATCWLENSSTGKYGKAHEVVEHRMYAHRHCLGPLIRGGTPEGGEQDSLF